MVVGSDNFRHVVEGLKPRFMGEIVILRTGNASIAAKNAGEDFSFVYQHNSMSRDTDVHFQMVCSLF